jgi:hypothetical protein
MTDEFKSNFSVLLKVDLPATEIELLSHYARRVISSQGLELLHFDCVNIDTSHHYYLSMETFKPGEDLMYPLWIPHHYVFMITGGDDRPGIGFTDSQ